MPPPGPVAPAGSADDAVAAEPPGVAEPPDPRRMATTTATMTRTATTAPMTARLAPCRGAAARALSLREVLPLVM